MTATTSARGSRDTCVDGCAVSRARFPNHLGAELRGNGCGVIDRAVVDDDRVYSDGTRVKTPGNAAASSLHGRTRSHTCGMVAP
jgi:hypothetical protein